MQTTQLNRIEKVLDYIHNNLSVPITVSDLAEKSCWSRWQFQRVFSQATGLSVAQYIRELRLSVAAESLISTKNRHLDIALESGFDSEISFSLSNIGFFGKNKTSSIYRVPKPTNNFRPESFLNCRQFSRKRRGRTYWLFLIGSPSKRPWRITHQRH